MSWLLLRLLRKFLLSMIIFFHGLIVGLWSKYRPKSASRDLRSLLRLLYLVFFSFVFSLFIHVFFDLVRKIPTAESKYVYSFSFAYPYPPPWGCFAKYAYFIVIISQDLLVILFLKKEKNQYQWNIYHEKSEGIRDKLLQ